MELPLSYTRLLHIAWKQYRLRFDVILTVHLCLSLPLNLLFDFLLAPRLAQVDAAQLTIIELWSIFIQPDYAAFQLTQLVISLFITVTVIMTLKYSYRQQLPSAQKIAKQAWRYYPRALAVMSMMGVLIVFGLIGFIFPGLIIWLLLSLSLPALIWYNFTSRQALQYSWQLVWKHWWPVLGYSVATQALVGIITLILGLILPSLPGFITIGLTIQAIIHSFIPVFSIILFLALHSQPAQQQTTAQE